MNVLFHQLNCSTSVVFNAVFRVNQDEVAVDEVELVSHLVDLKLKSELSAHLLSEDAFLCVDAQRTVSETV